MAQLAADRSEPAAVASAVANPAPLGLSAFALTTFVLSAANAGLFTAASIFVGAAIFYGGMVQILAGIQEFRQNNTFGATAFCSYGGFWLAYGILLVPSFGILSGLTKAQIDAGAAWFLMGWAIFTGFMFIGTLRANVALATVFGLLFLAYVALMLGNFGVGDIFTKIGGVIGILTALAAWYTAWAGIMNSTRSAFKLPVGPLG